MEQVTLRFQEHSRTVFVRELTGNDERCVCDTSTRTLVDLLNRLLIWPPGVNKQADELTASDRDLLLRVIYARLYGKNVHSTALCTACTSRYDITFSLDDLATEVGRSAQPSKAQSMPDGTFRTASGLRFRLPVARDEIEVSHLSGEEAAGALVARCLLESPADTDLGPEQSRSLLEGVMEDIAPIFDLETDTHCPECGSHQSVRFDLQFYLLRAIEQDRVQMVREIHRIASAYGWGFTEILSLQRSERLRLVRLIDEDLGARGRSA